MEESKPIKKERRKGRNGGRMEVKGVVQKEGGRYSSPYEDTENHTFDVFVILLSQVEHTIIIPN